MTFILTLNLDNDAFQHGNNGREVARILAVATASLPHSLQTGDRQRLRDLNGNTVGHWGVTA